MKMIVILSEEDRKEMDTMKPFTEAERELAEKNHNLVYEFLKSHKYDIEEYYNIAVMGYLKGIQKYYRRTERNISELPGICWNCMRSEMGNHFKMEKARKRQPVEMNQEAVHSAEDEAVTTELLNSVMENMTEQQQNIVALKILGYSNLEVCLMLEINTSSYYRELERIRKLFEEGK